jgi:UTP--glucose-1-phosphate uridylyltransferase
MKIRKAVITAAGPKQRHLPLQSLTDRDGVEKPVLAILAAEVLRAGIERIGVVVHPGDEGAYARVAGELAGALQFIPQSQPLGYGHAVYCARDFLAGEPFLHLVGDHVYVSRSARDCSGRLLEVAAAEECAVSAVQATRESLLPHFGAVGGQPVAGRTGLYRVDKVIEKPTPTEAEQRLIVPGLRAGYYLCFFGMHVLTPAVMSILEQIAGDGAKGITLSAALAELARREKYLALEQPDYRYDLGARYGLLNAQLALALCGRDRNEVLSQLVELLAVWDMDSPGK